MGRRRKRSGNIALLRGVSLQVYGLARTMTTNGNSEQTARLTPPTSLPHHSIHEMSPVDESIIAC